MQTPLPEQNESKLILDNLVELTSQREQEMLESSLLSTLVEVMHVDKVELFACRWVNSAPYIRRRLEAISSAGKPIITETTTDGWLPPPIFLYDLLNMLDRDDGIHRIPTGMCMPMRCMGSIISLVVIHTSSETKINRAMLKAMARIHENFLRLLFEADRDMLTALHNRRKFDLRFYNLMSSLQRPQTTQHPHILALLDVDLFKRVNDQFGHMVGDEVLLIMAQLMQQSFREDDGLFRYGGEEFALLLQASDILQAELALERFRHSVERHPFPQVRELTISIGYTQVNPALLPGQLIEQADRALYYAKAHGRNQVQCFEKLVAMGELESIRMDGQVDYF
ncbi:GGDEF domain-containing protein [Chromobacterium sp. IIBBL 290-4]|uniref:GGDEF domain-containing protein n=1 Tax=Chromobacterium sp. IIBBL 290-4 TaxID=2953890 RepID=UPI0020B799B7|nr:GGDEF domain-containing protein [Chromobacterium sp. IIBBL 290-4]UTH72948.1 GGDEF domain-containing protein [Chromobacterium sp. IIBBL 290-4]